MTNGGYTDDMYESLDVWHKVKFASVGGVDLMDNGESIMLTVLDAADPITTRHVGTIAFQGTDAQINEAMQRYFGGVK